MKDDDEAVPWENLDDWAQRPVTVPICLAQQEGTACRHRVVAPWVEIEGGGECDAAAPLLCRAVDRHFLRCRHRRLVPPKGAPEGHDPRKGVAIGGWKPWLVSALPLRRRWKLLCGIAKKELPILEGWARDFVRRRAPFLVIARRTCRGMLFDLYTIRQPDGRRRRKI